MMKPNYMLLLTVLFISIVVISGCLAKNIQKTETGIEKDTTKLVSKKLMTIPKDDAEVVKSFVDRSFTISPNGQRFAYMMIKDGKYLVVVDNQQSKAYDLAGLPFFSPDSKHFAYVAVEEKEEYDGKKYRKNYVVIDNKQDDYRYNIVGSLAFSPDSKYLTYGAVTWSDYGFYWIADEVKQ